MSRKDEVEKYVEHCYQQVLKRPVDPNGKEHYVTEILEHQIQSEALPNILRGSREYKERFRKETDFKHVLVVTPVRKAARWLPFFRGSFERLSYPREKLSFAFAVGQASDDSYGHVSKFKETFKNVTIGHVNLPGHNRFMKLTQIRNKIIEENLKDQEYVWSIDSDIVNFPPNILDQLIDHDVDIVAPLVLIEGTNRFYDILAFLYQGKQFTHALPYCPACKRNELFEVDSVGTCYLARSDIFKQGIKYSTHEGKISEQICFCQEARKKGFKIWVDPTIKVLHANLPKYGERFH